MFRRLTADAGQIREVRESRSRRLQLDHSTIPCPRLATVSASGSYTTNISIIRIRPENACRSKGFHKDPRSVQECSFSFRKKECWRRRSSQFRVIFPNLLHCPRHRSYRHDLRRRHSPAVTHGKEIYQAVTRHDQHQKKGYRRALQSWAWPNRLLDWCLSDLSPWLHGKRSHRIHALYATRYGGRPAATLAAPESRGLP